MSDTTDMKRADEDTVVINTTVVELATVEPEGYTWTCIYNPEQEHRDLADKCILALLDKTDGGEFAIVDGSPTFIAIILDSGNASDADTLAIAGLLLIEMVSPGDSESFEKWVGVLSNSLKLISYDGTTDAEIDQSKFVHLATPSEVKELFSKTR